MQFTINNTILKTKIKKHKTKCNQNPQNNQPSIPQKAVTKNLIKTLVNDYKIPTNVIQDFLKKFKSSQYPSNIHQTQTQLPNKIKEDNLNHKQKNQVFNRQGNIQITKLQQDNVDQDVILNQTKDKADQKSENNKVQTKIVKQLKKSTLLYTGKNVQIPYLHSQDASNQLNQQYCLGEGERQYTFGINPSPTPQELLTIGQIVLIYTNIGSLRDLGTGWPCLRILSVINCELVDLSGVNGFNRLQQLYVSYNKIVSIEELDYLGKRIKCLDLQENLIDQNQINTLQMMVIENSLIQGLQYLNLLGNPIWQKKQIKRQLIQRLGQKIFLQSLYQQKQQQAYDCVHQINQKTIKFRQIQLYSQIQYTNRLIQRCNHQLSQNTITVQGCINYYNKPKQHQQDQSIQIVRYDPVAFNQYSQQSIIEHQIIFTPLQHFLPRQHQISVVFKRYLSNRLKFNQQQDSELQKKPIQTDGKIKETKQKKSIINTVRLSKIMKKQQLEQINGIKDNIISTKSVQIGQQSTGCSLRVRKFNGISLSKEKAKIPIEKMSATSNLNGKFMSNIEDKVNKLAATTNFRNIKNAQQEVLSNRHIFKTLDTKQKLKSIHKKLPQIKNQPIVLTNY